MYSISTEDKVLIGFCIIDACASLICLLSIWAYYYHIAKVKCCTELEIYSCGAILMFGISCLGLLWQLMGGSVLITDLIWSMAWRIGSVFIYILFIKRLQFTFKDTIYAITKKMYFIIFYIGCIIFVLTNIFGYILLFMENGNKISSRFVELMWISIVIIQQIIHLYLSISSISLFIHKLWSMNIDIVHRNNNNQSNQFNTDLNDKQLTIIKAVSKITVLSSVPIISSQLFLLYEMILFILDIKYGYDISIEMTIKHLYLTIDCIISILCIALSFDFSNKLYHRICCYLDGLCRSMATNKAKRQVNQLQIRLIPNDMNL